MIKKSFQILFVLLLSAGVSAQKKSSKKQKPKKVEEASYVDIVALDAVSASENQINDIDTIRVAAGKPYVFLIKADEWNSQSFGDDVEEKELRKNFDNKAFELINIKKYSYITFGNGQYLDVSSAGSSYEAVAFWSGKNNDDIQTKEGLTKATEFVARQLGVKKESSYIINDKKYRKEIAELKTKNSFTDQSKKVMDVYLKRLSIPKIASVDERNIIFNLNQEKVKTVKTFVVDNGKKKMYEYIQLNENGKPLSATRYNSDGSEDGTMKFIYENDILKQIKKSENTVSVLYKDGQMIFNENIGEADETTVYYLENNQFLQKRYTIMLDNNYAQMNSFSEEKIVNNCINQTINNELWKVECSSNPNEFPYQYSYTSYQDGAVMQKKIYKINKKSDVSYELFQNDEDDTTESLKHNRTYLLNEKKLLKSLRSTKTKDAENIEIEYTYYP